VAYVPSPPGSLGQRATLMMIVSLLALLLLLLLLLSQVL
jgi:hypothetical protein